MLHDIAVQHVASFPASGISRGRPALGPQLLHDCQRACVSSCGCQLTLDNHVLQSHRDFVSQGASAGFTMAFVTPIAGTLFPAEEGGLAFAPSRLFMALASRCSAVAAFHAATAAAAAAAAAAARA